VNTTFGISEREVGAFPALFAGLCAALRAKIANGLRDLAARPFIRDAIG